MDTKNMADNKYGKLAKNTVIFLIGNFGSKIISFIIVPFYTYVLTTSEYGTVDLFTTSINILIPFVIVGLNEAVLRFLTAKEMDEQSVASNCAMVLLGTLFVLWLLYPMYKHANIFQGRCFQFVLLLSIMAFNQIFLQYLRGTGRTVAFALNGLIITVVTVTANCILLLVFHMGVDGYLYSLIAAQSAGAIEIIIASKLWSALGIKNIDFGKLKAMLIYCIPLIPNSLMWWVMNASDKYMITYYVGTSGNGIYSVAHKIPTIIQMFYSVFMQAWQISAIEEGQSKDRGSFYKNIYAYLSAFLMISGAAIIIIAKPLYTGVMNTDYKIAWKCVPLLIIANVFSCLSGFFGTTYVVNKESKKAFSTTLIGAISNLVLNCVFISMYGIQGAAIGTCLSYIIVCVIRSRDTFKYVGLKMRMKKEGIAALLMILQWVMLLVIESPIVYVAIGLIFMMIILLFKDEIAIMKSKFGLIIARRKRKKS